MHESKSEFTVEVFKAIRGAFAFALERRYEYVTVDNLMLFISHTPEGRKIFNAVGIDLEDYKREVIKYLDENVSKFPSDNIHEKPDPSVAFHRTLEQSSILQKVSKNNGKTDESYIIISLFELKKDETFTLNYFQHHSISRLDFYNFIAHQKVKSPIKINEKDSDNKSFLDKYAILLNNKAKEGKIDSVIGREDEINKVIEILAQRRKNNPILVGDPGVGKTAIAEGLAKKIVEGLVPNLFKNFLIYSIDLTAIVAGTKYRGDFEERLKGIIKEASSIPNIVLFIDEIHTLIGAGTSSGTMDAANIMKPALSSGLIKVIGATTYDEYRKYFEKEASLSRRFQKVNIGEPTEIETLEILKGLKEQYELFHNVTYEDSALIAAVKLTGKYISNKNFPDKAIDAIDMAGARIKLKNLKKRVITSKEISDIIARMINIPVNEIESSDKIKLKNLDLMLKKEIFGQDEAIDKVVENIILSRAELVTKDKPIASLLFAGPSGVGKTELSKQIAKNLNIPLIRFDMSEYMESHSIAKLIGTPPGYIGYNNGGQLTDAIRKDPYAVLLLDEIEKAHPDILNMLLQVMDYGVLTDNSGQKADFKNIIFIMTSNIGAREISKNVIGFNQVKNVNNDRDKEIKKSLAPEFVNRLDGILNFNALSNININKVVEKQLNKLQMQLLDKKIKMSYNSELISYIALNGFDEKMGARPIERYIEKNLSQYFAKELLFGKLEEGGEVIINIINNVIDFKILEEINITKNLPDNLSDSIISPAKKIVKRKKVIKSID